jgi:hypothetical protein
MPKKKSKDTQAAQSKRFVETAKALGVDESGKSFNQAIKGVLATKLPGTATAKPRQKGGR